MANLRQLIILGCVVLAACASPTAPTRSSDVALTVVKQAPEPAPAPEPTFPPSSDPTPSPAPTPAPAPAPPTPTHEPRPSVERWSLAIEIASPNFPLTGTVTLELHGDRAALDRYRGVVVQRGSDSLNVEFYEKDARVLSLRAFNPGGGWMFSLDGVAGSATGRVTR